MIKNLLFILTLISLSTFVVNAQERNTTAEKSDFKNVTTYDELTAFIHEIDGSSGLVKIEKIGQSAQGRVLNALLFSSTEFGQDPAKVKVLIFAQQHGNEQSGKEGALLLARELVKPENRYLFDRIDLALIPQVNPDGSEVNKRRNGNQADLNRNHLLLSEPETRALHAFFDKYLFEVSMDVHEYSPYGEEWKNAGFRKNSEITLGNNTNLNVSEQIRELSGKIVLPFLFDYLSSRNYSCFEYCPGDPPGTGYIRHSTFDINDGRQSLGIQNTLSFIQEGMNGQDNYTDNLQRRAEGQMTGMRGLLEFVYRNRKEISTMVGSERSNLIKGKSNNLVSIQSEHVSSGQTLQLPVYSYLSGNDSVVIATDYRPVVSSITDVTKPLGYLVPEQLKEIINWADQHHLVFQSYQAGEKDKIHQYIVQRIDSIDFEGDVVVDPVVEIKEFNPAESGQKYIFIPTAQLKGNLITIALEPKSMLGLVTYEKYSYLLKPGEAFPILRVEK